MTDEKMTWKRVFEGYSKGPIIPLKIGTPVWDVCEGQAGFVTKERKGTLEITGLNNRTWLAISQDLYPGLTLIQGQISSIAWCVQHEDLLARHQRGDQLRRLFELACMGRLINGDLVLLAQMITHIVDDLRERRRERRRKQ